MEYGPNIALYSDDEYSEEDSMYLPQDEDDYLSDSDLEDEEPSSPPPLSRPNYKIRGQFQDYIGSHDEFLPFTADEIMSIRLQDHLRMKKAPLNSCDLLMEWHLRERGMLGEQDKLSGCSHYISRETMLNRLTKRYNMEDKLPYQKKVRLPTSGAVVKITMHDAGAVIQSLLTDPRIEDSDYAFFNNDPLAAPPPPPQTQQEERRTYLGNLTSGQGYRDTYHQLIDVTSGKKQMLLPIPLYLDGAAISHFHDMELIQVKCSIGFWSRKTRMRECAWGVLGYVEKVHEQGGAGQKFYRGGNHMEVQDVWNSDSDGSIYEDIEGVGDHKDQDLHAMLSVILEPLVELQETGFVWSLCYRNTHYCDVLMKILVCVPFVKADTVEADKVCGKCGGMRCNGV